MAGVVNTLGRRARDNATDHETSATHWGHAAKVSFGLGAAAASAGLYPVAAAGAVGGVAALIKQGLHEAGGLTERNRATGLDYLNAARKGGSGKVSDLVRAPVAVKRSNGTTFTRMQLVRRTKD